MLDFLSLAPVQNIRADEITEKNMHLTNELCSLLP